MIRKAALSTCGAGEAREELVSLEETPPKVVELTTQNSVGRGKTVAKTGGTLGFVCRRVRQKWRISPSEPLTGVIRNPRSER